MTGVGDRVDRLTPIERRDAARAVVQSVGSRYGLSVEEMRAPIVRGRRGDDVARTAAAVRLAAAILVDDLGLSMGGAEEHTSELQSLAYLVCRLLLEKKNQPVPRTS